MYDWKALQRPAGTDWPGKHPQPWLSCVDLFGLNRRSIRWCSSRLTLRIGVRADVLLAANAAPVGGTGEAERAVADGKTVNANKEGR